MNDSVAPPAGPPPPKVPEGWKAQWNDQYSEWFYVNIYTKKSQWEKPTEPVYPPQDDAPPGAPPGYAPSTNSTGDASHSQATDQKHNPYIKSNTESDEEYARRLQAEEDARAQGSRSAQQDYGSTPMPGYGQGSYQGGSQYPQQPDYSQQNYGQQQPGQQGYPNELPPRTEQKKGGFLGKLLSKASGAGSSSRPMGSGYPQQQHYGQQPMYGQGYPQQQMGGMYGRPMMGGGMMGGGRKKPGGMGMAGGAALGVGGGMLGGMMLANAMDDDDYRDGYQDGQEDGGGDFGGGDDGGGGD